MVSSIINIMVRTPIPNVVVYDGGPAPAILVASVITLERFEYRSDGMERRYEVKLWWLDLVVVVGATWYQIPVYIHT